jgi:bacterioferritin
MKGDAKVLSLLNEVLTAELTAINQYFVHSEICESYGYTVLYAKIREESIDEMRHAEKLIERILYLEGLPNMSRYSEIRIGRKVEEMLANDLKLEKDAVERLNRGIGLCAEVNDHGTRDLLQVVLTDEERHVDWIESQIEQIDQIGIANYLSQQVRPKQE